MRDYTPERVAELTGIPAEDIVSLAREYATTRPAGIRLNYGVQRSERGGIGRSGHRAAPGADRRRTARLAADCSFPLPRPSSSTGTALERPDLQPQAPTRLSTCRELDHAL